MQAQTQVEQSLIYNNNTKKYLQTDFDLRTNNAADRILDGQQVSKFVIINSIESGKSVINVYSIQTTYYKLFTSIQETIIAFDAIQIGDLVIIYAIQYRNQQTYLVSKQIKDENEENLDYQVYFNVECNATDIKVSKSLIALACPTYKNNTGQIILYQRLTFELIANINGRGEDQVGLEMDIIAGDNEIQTYLIFTYGKVNKTTQQQLQYIEVLIDNYKSGNQQYVSPVYTINYPTDSSNNGSLRLAGGWEKLFITTSIFDKIQGYHFCSYNQYLNKDTNKCMPCGRYKTSLGPSSDSCIDCQSDFSGSDKDNKKLSFICEIIEGKINLILIVALSILCFGIICLIVVSIVMCKVKGFLCFKKPIAEIIRDQEERLARRWRLIDLKLNKLKFDKLKLDEKSQSCSICFEEFTADLEIRSTQCKHVFHEKCIYEWIKTKLSDPDCPYCRTKIII
ncbi:e3 ubiquitin-protein ligase rnf13 [Stylonychia lemnae]|uniref:E3 ubiquitin-protein ligase rnf13 n=1 Tax=Stylonychia lemnae TaxID=5949 RepID=A0A078ATC7_STYLE|nr:e3 ubiquitin-protein ligase rnf13 [Stylonychia lemnae]|eukprot:CDW85266.1 e3 ubiquitin-protein ligase rnf13 [Stylonychia lemnae]